MPFSDDGWLDWAERIPGNPDKLWPGDFTPEGALLHSAVGTYQGVINIVLGPVSNGRSVTGCIRKDGHVAQFYSIFKAPWANGQRSVNQRFRGWEEEGGGYWPNTNPPQPNFSEPLTKEQIESSIRILRDMQHKFGTPWTRPLDANDINATAWEHNEMRRFGAAGTACPSGRIPWNDIIPYANYTPVERDWIRGDQMYGEERRGNQIFYWHRNVEVDALGDYDGLYPGRHYHNQAGSWVQVLP